MKALIGKALVKIAFYLVEHPDVIRGWLDALHAGQQPKAQPAPTP